MTPGSLSGALVVGEALIDQIDSNGASRRHVGGSPANVSLGLARLGVPTRLHTAIGSDADGDEIAAHVEESGVALTAASRTSERTSVAKAEIGVDGAASYTFEISWNPNDLDVSAFHPRLVHTGSLASFLDPGADVVTHIVATARRTGSLISFDPNIRPALLESPSLALRRFRTLAFQSHLIKLSDEDAKYLFPDKPLDYVLDVLLDGGAAVVAITRGHEGARLASGSRRLDVAPVRTTVADTIGAGDSFMAALIWALAFRGAAWDGDPIAPDVLTESGRIAAAAAAMTVSRAGADLPRASDLDTFLSEADALRGGLVVPNPISVTGL